MKSLTTHQIEALNALGYATYLTPNQFCLDWGVVADKGNLVRRVLKPLREARPAFIRQHKRGAVKEDVYCLTRAGAIALSEATGQPFESITFPAKIQYENDFDHRRRTISFLIALHHWAQATGTEILEKRTYYTVVGAQQSRQPCQPITRHHLKHEVFEPDAELLLAMERGERRLFAVEYHNGRDAQKVVNQLLLHTRAIKAKTLSKAYQHLHSNYVLSVYRYRSMMESVQKRLLERDSFTPYRAHFLFNTLEQCGKSYEQGWHDATDEVSDLFNQAKTE